MQNITTVVGITPRGNGCKCVIYVQLIVINICTGTKFICFRGGRIEYKYKGEGMKKLVEWFLV